MNFGHDSFICMVHHVAQGRHIQVLLTAETLVCEEGRKILQIGVNVCTFDLGDMDLLEVALERVNQPSRFVQKLGHSGDMTVGQLVKVVIVEHELAVRHLTTDVLPKALTVNAQFVLVFEQGVLDENFDTGCVLYLQLLFEEILWVDHFIIGVVYSSL